jgi:hypothetical protein
MAPAEFAALVATARQASVAENVRDALQVAAAAGDGPARSEHYVVAYGTATAIHKAKEHFEMLIGAASAHAVSADSASAAH